MSTILFTDLKEGDLIEVKDAIRERRLARVVRFTREGKLVVQRRWYALKSWGPPLEISLDEILRKVASRGMPQ